MKIRLAGILPNSLVNGYGLRKVFFSQGCNHHCDECFNQHTWPFVGGKICDCDQLIKETIAESYLAGVTFSGGDPLQQPIPFSYLAKKLKKNNINIWCFTGYTWEEIIKLKKKDIHIKILIENLDVLVDGRFDKNLKNVNLKFAGSSNQRIIDVKQTLKKKKIIIWQQNN